MHDNNNELGYVTQVKGTDTICTLFFYFFHFHFESWEIRFRRNRRVWARNLFGKKNDPKLNGMKKIEETTENGDNIRLKW